MVAIARVRTEWTGFNGAPGYTNLFFRDFGNQEPIDVDAAVAAAAAARVVTFWNTIEQYFPNDVTLRVDNVVDVLEDSTGELVDSFSTPVNAPILGTNTGSYSAATGGVIGWTTGSIRNGRRIRGRTFLVPLASLVMSTSGRIEPGVVSTIQTSASALADNTSTPDLGVWARPTASGASDGQWAVVTGARVTDLPAVLRSRRD